MSRQSPVVMSSSQSSLVNAWVACSAEHKYPAMLALQDTLSSIDESHEVTFDGVKDLIDKVKEGLATVRAEALEAAKADPSQLGSSTASLSLPSPAPAAEQRRDGPRWLPTISSGGGQCTVGGDTAMHL